MTTSIVTPYRLVIFGTSTRTVGKGKRQRTVTTGYGFCGWTPVQFFDEGARLPNAGSFLYAGGLRAVKAARTYLQEPNIHQVQIRTNQDQKVLVYNKHADGRVTCYAAGEE